MSWPQAIASKPPSAPHLSEPKLVKTMLRRITTEGPWALQRNDFSFESAITLHVLVCASSSRTTRWADVARGKPVSSSPNPALKNDSLRGPQPSHSRTLAAPTECKCKTKDQSITTPCNESGQALISRQQSFRIMVLPAATSTPGVNVRPACGRRTSCHEPADSGRSDRRCWSTGQAPAATAGRPR
jgi:hypothetical protein